MLNGNCTGVTEYSAILAEWADEEPYKTYYRFWFRTVITVFLPFMLLVYCNVRIVHRLREQHLAARLFRFATSEHRVLFQFFNSFKFLFIFDSVFKDLSQNKLDFHWYFLLYLFNSTIFPTK